MPKLRVSPITNMDLAYWNRFSENYQSEVLSVFDNDIHRLVEEKIAEAGNFVTRHKDLGYRNTGIGSLSLNGRANE